MNSRKATHRWTRRGAVVVLSALLLVVMLGIVAFAVDIGYMLVVRTQLQAAAESAALAAAANLANSRAQLVAVGQQYAAYHTASGKAATVTPADIEVGMWDLKARTFAPGSPVANAVRVTARRDAST